MTISELKTIDFQLNEYQKENLQIWLDRVNESAFWDEYSEQEYNAIFKILHMHYEEIREWSEDDDTQYEDYLVLSYRWEDIKKYDDYADLWNDFNEIADSYLNR